MSTSSGTRTNTSAPAKRLSLRERGAEATHNLRDAMQIPYNTGDTGILGTALAEAAAEEGRRNPRFASEVRRIYGELLDQQRPAAARPARAPQPPLKPVRTDLPFRPIDPFAPPDPQYLIQVYGRHQLEPALQRYNVSMLKRTVAVIEQQYPGTKPANRGRKDSLIAYIMEHSRT